MSPIASTARSRRPTPAIPALARSCSPTTRSARLATWTSTPPVRLGPRADKCHVSHVVLDTNSLGGEARPEPRGHARGRRLRQELRPRLHDPLHARTIRAGSTTRTTSFGSPADRRARPRLTLILEVTGEKKKDKEAKVDTARRLWVPAVNNDGSFGRWAFLEIKDPWRRPNRDPGPPEISRSGSRSVSTTRPRRTLFRVHALQRMFERRIGVEDVLHVVATGDTIEEYPSDTPFPSCLILGFSGRAPFTSSRLTIRRPTTELSLPLTSLIRRSGSPIFEGESRCSA